MVFIRKIDWFVEKVSSHLLVVTILAILLCSCLSIVLRWFHINLTWADSFVRHLVLLGTFLGGVIATGRGNHIGIDLISKLLEVKGLNRAKIIVNRIILVTSGLVLTWMIKSGVDFTIVEMEFSKTEFWGIGSGYLVAMITLGLSLISIRFFTLFLLSFESNLESQKEGEA